jgi:hypothetical protein
MLRKTAVVICNWNKKDYVLKCINSVLTSTIKDVDVYVVDNASTDGSTVAIYEQYRNKVFVIENEINKGGAGGFNTGIEAVLEKGYTYIHLLDNDAFLDAYTLENSMEFLEQNPDVGVVGSKIYLMDAPEQIQEMGARINYNTFNIELNYGGAIDDGTIPDVLECDYVPACSMMIRTEALRKAGTMDEQYFIYWDDIDLGYRIKQAGYRIVSYGQAKAWHKRGAAAKTNTFSTYYFWRNRVHFFASYLTNEDLMRFAERLQDEMFQAIYMSNYTGRFNNACTILFAVEDALDGVRGRARNKRIVEREQVPDRFIESLRKYKQIEVIAGSSMRTLRSVIEAIYQHCTDVKVALVSQELSVEELSLQFPDVPIYSRVGESNSEFICQTCNHISEVRNEICDDIHMYVDQFFNVIESKKDRDYIKAYDTAYELFRNIHLPVLKQRLREWKGRHGK